MLPPDVDPGSRCRLPLPRREELDAARQRIYDALADPAGGSLRGLQGPGGIQLHSPGLAPHSRPLNRYLRYETGLPPQLRELAILVVAREVGSQFEWAAHEAEARAEGLSQESIEAVRQGRPAAGLDEREAIVVALGREIFGARKLGSDTFAKALAAFGRGGLVDLVALMGSYAATAALLLAFDMQLDDGVPPPF